MKWITAIVFSTSVPDAKIFLRIRILNPFPDLTDSDPDPILAVSTKNNFLKILHYW
jgi:hypothetical protein